jgi:hypothetical protein
VILTRARGILGYFGSPFLQKVGQKRKYQKYLTHFNAFPRYPIPLTRETEMGRKCCLCGDGKRDEDFGADRRAPNGLRRRCKCCEKLVNALRYKVKVGKMSKEKMRQELHTFRLRKMFERIKRESL